MLGARYTTESPGRANIYFDLLEECESYNLVDML